MGIRIPAITGYVVRKGMVSFKFREYTTWGSVCSSRL